MHQPSAAAMALPASARVRRLTVVGWAGATLLSVAAGIADQSWRNGAQTAAAARYLAGGSMLLAGVVAVASAWERRRRDLPRRQFGLAAFAAGFAVVFGGQFIGYLLAATTPGPFQPWIEDLPLLIGAPLLTAGCLALSWPPGLSRRQITGIVGDSVLAASGLLVIWLIWLVPTQRTEDAGWGGLLQAVDPWVQFLGVMCVIVMAAASRRSGSLPIRQLMLVQAALLAYLITDILGDRSSTVLAELNRSAIKGPLIGYLIAVALGCAFAVRPALETDRPRSGRWRDVWAYLLPYLPLPVSLLGLLWYRVTIGPLSVGFLVLLVVVVMVSSTVVVLDRINGARDRRHLAEKGIPDSVRQGVRAEWFAALVGDTRDLVTVVDRDGRIVFQTPSLAPLLGYQPDEMSGRMFADLTPEQSTDDIARLLLRSAHDPDDRGPYDLTMLDRSGELHDTETVIAPLYNDGSDGYVLTSRDVTDRRLLRAQLVDSSLRDAMTRLPNREAFLARLRQELPVAAPGTLAVALCDLDNFRDFNDSRGHEAGDHVLRVVADTLARLPVSVVAVARTGADEFGLLVIADPVELALGQAERDLRLALNGMLMTDGQTESVAVDIGYTVAQSRTTASSELMEQADLAIAAARTDHNASLVRYDPVMRTTLITRLRAEADLREALAADRLEVHYQPCVRMKDGALTGVEALVRLRGTDGTLVAPDDFIPRAEELGLIKEVGRRVLQLALTDLRRISEVMARPVSLSVNVSAHQVDQSLTAAVLESLRSSGTDPRDLTLELTESVLAGGAHVGEVLESLRGSGCRLSLDDFGTGYSSLTYLADLPVDQLKIDRSFVGAMGSSSRALVLVRTVLQMARSLGLSVVAEGVETMEQADLLRGMDCDLAQGFLFAAPMSIDDLLLTLQVTEGVLPLSSDG